MDEAVRDVFVAEGGVRTDEPVEERELEGIGAGRVLDPDAGVTAVTGVGGIRAVEEVDPAILPQLDLEADPGRRARDFHPRVLDDEGTVGAGANGLVVDRAVRVDREVLPQRVDRRIRRQGRRDRDREAVVLVRRQEVQVAIVGEEDLGVRRAVELEGKRQAEPPGELITVEAGLAGGINPVERDRPAAVAEVVELAEEREVLGDVGIDEADVGGRDLRAAAG